MSPYPNFGFHTLKSKNSPVSHGKPVDKDGKLNTEVENQTGKSYKSKYKVK